MSLTWVGGGRIGVGSTGRIVRERKREADRPGEIKALLGGRAAMTVARIRESKLSELELKKKLGWGMDGGAGAALRGDYAPNVSGGQEKRCAGHNTQTENERRERQTGGERR